MLASAIPISMNRRALDVRRNREHRQAIGRGTNRRFGQTGLNLVLLHRTRGWRG
jgi:hypothetical protein